MSRDFQIQGPCMVRVRGGEHWSGGPLGSLTELGMTNEPIKVELVRFYRRIGADDFGPNASVDTMWNLGECNIRMKLIHFDPLVLKCSLSDSMGGGGEFLFAPPRAPVLADTLIALAPGLDMRPAGSLLGNGLPRFASGNYYEGLNLSSPFDFNGDQWRFFYCYLSEQPVVYKIGCEANVVELTWKAITYAPIYASGSYPQLSTSSVGASPGEIWLTKINQATNNGPEWTPQITQIETPPLTVPTVDQTIADAAGPTEAGQADPAAGGDDPIGINFTIVKEVLSSGCMLWDHGRDD